MRYGWQLKDIEEKRNLCINSQNVESQDAIFVYDEMLADVSGVSQEDAPSINSYQFRKAINHFQPATRKEEINAVLYFGAQLHQLELELPISNLSSYGEAAAVDLAKTYMRRKEPKDYNYFRKIIGKGERIQFCYLANPSVFLGKNYFLHREEYYILINCINTVQDAITLLHETSHVENYLKYGCNPSVYYAELTPMTREHYGFDVFRNYDSIEEVEKQRALSLNHYLVRAIRLYHALQLLMQLKQQSSYLREATNRFEKFSALFNIEYLYNLLEKSLDKEIGYVLSFIASLDIYMHCEPREANLFITSYQIGTRKVSTKSIDRVVNYLLQTLKPYQKVKSV